MSQVQQAPSGVIQLKAWRFSKQVDFSRLLAKSYKIVAMSPTLNPTDESKLDD